jgi:hypothetical protein
MDRSDAAGIRLWGSIVGVRENPGYLERLNYTVGRVTGNCEGKLKLIPGNLLIAPTVPSFCATGYLVAVK